MSDYLTRFERDMVISSLISEPSKILISPIADESKTATLNQTDYQIIKNQIIYFKKLDTDIFFSDTMPVKVFFYYKGRGLFFVTNFSFIKSGYALVIPQIINKQPDAYEKRNKGIKAIIYFSANQKLNIDCFPLDSYPLFDYKICPDLEKQKFISDTRTIKSVECFFTDKPVLRRAVEGRIDPLSILFLTDKEIVFGSSSNDMPLQHNVEYGIEIQIPHEVFTRTIYATIRVKKIIGDTEDISTMSRTAALCAFTQIKAEDSRFLYEKLYSEHFNDGIQNCYIKDSLTCFLSFNNIKACIWN